MTHSLGATFHGVGMEVAYEYLTYYIFEGSQTGTEVWKGEATIPTLLPPAKASVEVDSNGNQKAGVKISQEFRGLIGIKGGGFIGIRRKQ